MKLVKQFKIEYLLYLFIIISPFLDISSFLFREKFPNCPFSPSTIIRPLIPCIMLIYVFFKDKNVRWKLFFMGLIYLVYAVIHLYLYKTIKTGISYGNLLNEAQYIINYTYMIFVLYLYLYFNKKKGLPYLKKSLFISLICYVSSIYLAIITNTSYPTYLEGTGFRGWFLSGNAIGTILILLFITLFHDLFTSRKLSKYLLLLLTGIYLIFLLGTRTGLFGTILCIGAYIGSYILIKLFKDKKLNLKKILLALFGCISLVVLVFCFGTESFERRKHLTNEASGIIDVNTNEIGHTTGDTSIIVKQIRDNEVPEGYLSEAQKETYLDLYEYANKHKLISNDRRQQQMIYHIYLVKNQKNILYILFGNGYLSSYGEMILEMEILAILFNFGIVGFILYLVPFLYLLFRFGYKILKNKKLSIENIMFIFAICLALILSFLAGYVFFSLSCVLIIITILTMLQKEVET